MIGAVLSGGEWGWSGGGMGGADFTECACLRIVALISRYQSSGENNWNTGIVLAESLALQVTHRLFFSHG